MTSPSDIVLASTSVRRKEILSLLGLPFRIVAPRFEEILTDRRSAAEEVAGFAEGKARSVEKELPGSLIIGSDTLIDLEGEKIGKPRDRDDAKRILKRLQGRPHRIWTAVALIDASGSARIETAEVKVLMQEMSAEEIEKYVETGEPLNKAGAYSLQGDGARFIAKLKGDYLAAVGLPLQPVALFLKERGVSVPIDIKRLYRERTFMNWKRYYPDPG